MNHGRAGRSATLVLGGREFEIPAVEAVATAVGHDVAGVPPIVFARMGEESARAAAIDAHDLRLGSVGGNRRHPSSLPDGT